MMDQLGIKALRPAPGGKIVTAAQMWWKQRRPEIVEDYGREMLGRHPVIGKQLSGDVDNTQISVDIR